MDLVSARQILESLADGLDPASGEALGSGSPTQSPDVIDALRVALGALDEQTRRRDRATQLPAKAGQPWTREEDRALAEAFDAGHSVAVIAERFQRTEGSIAARLVRIGKVTDRDSARAMNQPPRSLSSRGLRDDEDA